MPFRGTSDDAITHGQTSRRCPGPESRYDPSLGFSPQTPARELWTSCPHPRGGHNGVYRTQHNSGSGRAAMSADGFACANFLTAQTSESAARRERIALDAMAVRRVLIEPPESLRLLEDATLIGAKATCDERLINASNRRSRIKAGCTWKRRSGRKWFQLQTQ